MEEIVIHITHTSDVGEARRAARTLALGIGSDEKMSEEVTLVASELASNLVKHAQGGTLAFSPLAEGGRVGIQIESLDSGPGIADVEQAMTDGFSTTGSLGYGLGTVNRLMDEVQIMPRTQAGGAGPGTRIVCRRWVRGPALGLIPCPLDLSAASRMYPGMEVNGDTFVIKKWGESALVGLIDGLGHGQWAQHAALAARDYIENHFDQPLEAIFRGVGRTCRATRGVVMALARFDWAQGRLTFASVGDVQVRVFGPSAPLNFILRRGIVGLSAPSPVVTTHTWLPGSLLVLHSDGIMTRWRLEDFPHLAEAPAAVIAHQLVHRLAKDNDDATVVVVK